ncbi:hypothetical protein PAXRUDRAFT_233752 [Paxillus rubicundulus Ve08.2h10]|uniref:Uncharacterized protein n=1 Tax=Paxillus rubicundulus Ve08.2h10 TaxID=930991 RepID=A0A0D0E6Y7_9AGAM|nr:hypothetical protein PAXRUDRAFT_233752 [Paxillus rubicundulus Ve08.2h10]
MSWFLHLGHTARQPRDIRKDPLSNVTCTLEDGTTSIIGRVRSCGAAGLPSRQVGFMATCLPSSRNVASHPWSTRPFLTTVVSSPSSRLPIGDGDQLHPVSVNMCRPEHMPHLLQGRNEKRLVLVA